MTGITATIAISNGINELDWSATYGSTIFGPLVFKLRLVLVTLAGGSSSSGSTGSSSSSGSGIGSNFGISINRLKKKKYKEYFSKNLHIRSTVPFHIISALIFGLSLWSIFWNVTFNIPE